MRKNKIVFLIIAVFLLSLCGTPAFTGGPDDEGNYYPDTADQIVEWNITIDSLKLVKDDETQVPIITSTTDPVNIADPDIAAGEVAGLWADNVAITPGTYTGILFLKGATSSINGCIQIGDDTWRATGQGDTSYATKGEALAAATAQTFTFGNYDEEDLPFDETTQQGPVTIGAGERYTLKILWDVTGTVEADPENNPGHEFPGEYYGVCLLWDTGIGALREGRLNEEYIIERTD